VRGEISGLIDIQTQYLKMRLSRRSGFSSRRKRRPELSRFEKKMLDTDGAIIGIGRAVAMGYGGASDRLDKTMSLEQILDVG